MISLFVFTFCSDEEPSPSPTAEFSCPDRELTSPCTISFIDLSIHADELLWDFDDGQTSTEENPSHLFKIGGNYNVKLIAKNDVGHDEFTKQIFIKQSTAYQVKNNSSFNLIYVSSFYDSNNYILDQHHHGDLSINESSDIFSTERENISVLFKFNINDEYWALTANPFVIQTNYLNVLILKDDTEIIPVTLNSKNKNILEITTNSKKVILKDIINN